jgi:hypothetical protein
MIDGPVRPLRSRRGELPSSAVRSASARGPDPDSSEIASPDHDPGPYRGQPNRRRVRADRGHSSNTPTLSRSSRKITAAPHARAGIGADHDDVLLLGRHGRFGRWRLLSVEVRHRRARRIPTAIGLPAADGAGRRAAARLVRSNPMSALAPALQAYFTGRLNSQRAASPNPSPPTNTPPVCCWPSPRDAPTQRRAIGIPMLLRPPGPRPRRGGHLQHPSTGQS